MTADPLVLVGEVDRATGLLLDTARSLDDAAVAAPSLLPGWTRGHVLTHIARNADSLVNLLTWARTGVETPQYPSSEQRDADIAAGAGRPAAAHLADLTEAAQRFAAAARAVPPHGWATQVRWTAGRTGPAAGVMWSRLREVEVHHVDLGASYAPKDWPDWFTHRLLHEVAANFAETGPPVRVLADDLGHELTVGGSPAVTVSGPAHAIAAWLTGRSTGHDLAVEPDGALPPVPTWK